MNEALKHGPHDHAQAAPTERTPDARLILSLAFNLLITLMQLVGGLVANSLGLLSDAAHNLSDV